MGYSALIVNTLYNIMRIIICWKMYTIYVAKSFPGGESVCAEKNYSVDLEHSFGLSWLIALASQHWAPSLFDSCLCPCKGCYCLSNSSSYPCTYICIKMLTLNRIWRCRTMCIAFLQFMHMTATWQTNFNIPVRMQLQCT